VVHIPQEMGVKCWAFVGHFQEETEAETMPFKQKRPMTEMLNDLIRLSS
jgi:hypothetical protein